jgi:catechol O-methyltransferase
LTWLYERPDLSQVRGSPSAVLAAFDEYSGQEDFLISIGEDKAKIITSMVLENKPKTFVEIGGYMGYSAIAFAHAMQKALPNSPAGNLRVFSLELDPLCAAIAMSVVDLAGLSDIIKIITGPASESLNRLVSQGTLKSVDMLLIDHREDMYITEFQTCEKLGLLQNGSIIIADNVVRPGAPEYREMVRKHPRLKSHGVKALIMPGEFEVEFSTKSSLFNEMLTSTRTSSKSVKFTKKIERMDRLR